MNKTREANFSPATDACNGRNNRGLHIVKKFDTIIEQPVNNAIHEN